MGAAKFVGGPQIVELRFALGQTASGSAPATATETINHPVELSGAL